MGKRTIIKSYYDLIEYEINFTERHHWSTVSKVMLNLLVILLAEIHTNYVLLLCYCFCSILFHKSIFSNIIPSYKRC